MTMTMAPPSRPPAFTATPVPLLTDEEYLRAMETPGVEYVDGVLKEHSMGRHSAFVTAKITSLLLSSSEESGLAECYSETLSYRCFKEDPKKFRRPDVSVVRKERLTGIDADAGALTIPPDLAVEVVSTNDLVEELQAKLKEYLSNGFRLIWVVSPATRSVAIYRMDGSHSLLADDDEITGESVLPSFRCKVSAFFPPTPATPAEPAVANPT